MNDSIGYLSPCICLCLEVRIEMKIAVQKVCETLREASKAGNDKKQHGRNLISRNYGIFRGPDALGNLHILIALFELTTKVI